MRLAHFLRLAISTASLVFSFSALAIERIYYIAADEINWDYAPIHENLMMGHKLHDDQLLFVKRSETTIGSVYKKSLYRGYTDASFSTVKTRTEEEEHLGLLGPIIRAEVGDTVKIIFKNNGTRPYTIHAHGVFYDKASEGAPTNDGTTGKDKKDDFVKPGETYTYHWNIPQRAGPGPADPSSIVWLYHSHVKSIQDSNSGLVGAIIVTAKGMATADGRPKDVDREFINLYAIMNENESWHLADNIANAGIDSDSIIDDENFEESNLMHAINGYVFANIPKLNMVQHERVRWYLVALGSEQDLHTPHWHGATVLHNGNRTDVVELMPASMKTVDMQPDSAGTWMYHCHVNDHISAGMTALYHISPAKEQAPQ